MKYIGGILNAMDAIKKKEEKMELNKQRLAKKEVEMKNEGEYTFIKIRTEELVKAMNAKVEVKKPVSEKQLTTRAKFGMAIKFLTQVREFILKGPKTSARKDSFAVLTSELIKEGFRGTYPNLEIDFSKVRFSRGNLPVPYDLGFQSLDKKTLFVSWDNEKYKLPMSAAMDDEITILIYNVSQGKFYWDEPVLRKEERVLVQVKSAEPGDRFALFLFIENGNITNSKFLGEGRFR